MVVGIVAIIAIIKANMLEDEMVMADTEQNI